MRSAARGTAGTKGGEAGSRARMPPCSFKGVGIGRDESGMRASPDGQTCTTTLGSWGSEDKGQEPRRIGRTIGARSAHIESPLRPAPSYRSPGPRRKAGGRGPPDVPGDTRCSPTQAARRETSCHRPREEAAQARSVRKRRGAEKRSANTNRKRRSERARRTSYKRREGSSSKTQMAKKTQRRHGLFETRAD